MVFRNFLFIWCGESCNPSPPTYQEYDHGEGEPQADQVQEEESQKRQVPPIRPNKKMKYDWNANTISLDSDDMKLMTNTITKSMQSSFKSIGEWQEEILGTVTELLTVLYKAVEEVNIIVDGPSTAVDSQAPS